MRNRTPDHGGRSGWTQPKAAIQRHSWSCCQGPIIRRAFSLVELVVVIAIAVMLTGLLMPALHQLHENAHRIVCLSNLQQLGTSFMMYGHDNNDALPFSHALHDFNDPQELMASKNAMGQWDGFGVLFDQFYCGRPECFYCPSHHGEHHFDRYADQWVNASPMTPVQGVFTNFHYAGDIDWSDHTRRNLLDGYHLVLATDGLRTVSDFNHISGMNVLRGDGSVHWREDNLGIFELLPKTVDEPPVAAYMSLWDNLTDLQ